MSLCIEVNEEMIDLISGVESKKLSDCVGYEPILLALNITKEHLEVLGDLNKEDV